MKEKTLPELKLEYNRICEEYLKRFSKKQDLDIDGWAGGEVGGVAGFAGQYFFNLSDMILDLNDKCPKGQILQWQDDNLEWNSSINYYSYSKGLRHKDIVANGS